MTKPNTKPQESWEEELKDELLDKIEEYFPKGIKGRGEAAVIVGLAMAKFSNILSKERTQLLEQVREIIEVVEIKGSDEKGNGMLWKWKLLSELSKLEKGDV